MTIIHDHPTVLRFRPGRSESRLGRSIHFSYFVQRPAPYPTHFLLRSRAVMVTNSTTPNLPSFNFPSQLFSLLISSSESHRETGTSATPRSPPIYPLRSRVVIKTLQVNGLFCLCARPLMSFDALKQYFRSRHGKTSYTEEEPSTLFFLRMANPEITRY